MNFFYVCANKLIQISSNPVLVTRRQEEQGDIILGQSIDYNIHRALVKEEQENKKENLHSNIQIKSVFSANCR